MESVTPVESPQQSLEDVSSISSRRSPMLERELIIRPRASPHEEECDRRILNEIKKRQTEFRAAALQAKQVGDIELARAQLRTLRQLDRCITTVAMGAIVEPKHIPPSPRLNPDFEGPVLTMDECAGNPITVSDLEGAKTNEQRRALLREILSAQAEDALASAQLQKRTGCVQVAEELNSLVSTMRSAINTLRKRDVQPIHKFHTVRLPRLNKNLHLRDDQLQVQIDWIVTDCESPGKVSDVTTFVRVELHFPSGEEAQHLETEEFGVFDNVSRGHADMLFQVNTAHWFHTRFVVLKVHIKYVPMVSQDLYFIIQNLTENKDKETMQNAARPSVNLILQGPQIAIVQRPWIMIDTVQPRNDDPLSSLRQSRINAQETHILLRESNAESCAYPEERKRRSTEGSPCSSTGPVVQTDLTQQHANEMEHQAAMHSTDQSDIAEATVFEGSGVSPQFGIVDLTPQCENTEGPSPSCPTASREESPHTNRRNYSPEISHSLTSQGEFRLSELLDTVHLDDASKDQQGNAYSLRDQSQRFVKPHSSLSAKAARSPHVAQLGGLEEQQQPAENHANQGIDPMELVSRDCQLSVLEKELAVFALS
ncbi:unnamed protein product [Dicrocoelium dendriticum]|nr:unnamed protein product [Dicrocoelium dendriticum]